MKQTHRQLLRRFAWPLAFVLVGGLLGFGYYFTVGCVTGTCAITSNPVLSTLYGAVFGYLVSVLIPRRTKAKRTLDAHTEETDSSTPS